MIEFHEKLLQPRMTATAEAMNVSEIAFTPWTPWNERKEKLISPGEVWGGVYMFAHFINPQESQFPPWPDLNENTIYIGETKNLNDRPLTQHNRTERYVELFGDPEFHRLYVCVFRVYDNHITRVDKAKYMILRSYAEFVEAQLDWDFTRRHGRRPAMHFKAKRRQN